MIKKLNPRIIALSAMILLIASLTGCKDMFKNPLLDKKTGDQITVLLIDRNFIKTKLVVRLVDISTQNPIDQEQVDVRFIGDDASNLINFTGKKMTDFNTNTGYVEVGYDPNIVLGEQNPQELTIMALSPNYVSAPQVVTFTTDGVKNLTIKMIRTTFGKGLSTGSHGEPFDLTYAGVLNSPTLGFNRNISSLPTGTAYEYINLYMPVTSGNLVCSNLTDPVVYSDYGVYFVRWAGGSSIIPPALPTKNTNLLVGDFVYSTMLRSGLLRCNSGLTIHMARADEKAGSGTFDYRITYSNGQTSTGSISCTFPCDNLIEPIYYPSANGAVKVEVFGDSQYDISQAVNLASACGNKADFIATPKSNLNTIKFTIQYTCPDNPIGIALSIGGEFRKAGTTGDWTSFEFVEGVCSLQMEPLADYDIRVNIDGEYHSFLVPTDPVKVQAAIQNQASPDYEIKSLTILPTEFGFDVTTSIQFSTGVCDILN